MKAKPCTTSLLSPRCVCVYACAVIFLWREVQIASCGCGQPAPSVTSPPASSLQGDQHASDAQLTMYPSSLSPLCPPVLPILFHHRVLVISVHIVKRPASFSYCYCQPQLSQAVSLQALCPSPDALLCILSWPQRHLNRMMPQKVHHREQVPGASPNRITTAGLSYLVQRFQPTATGWNISTKRCSSVVSFLNQRYVNAHLNGGYIGRRSYFALSVS